jgi:acetyl-CoA synthetase
MRTIWGDPERFIEAYFSTYPGSYFTGDGARRDKDGYYWITGRVDDVLNVSGHRLGTLKLKVHWLRMQKSLNLQLLVCHMRLKGKACSLCDLTGGVAETEELRKELVIGLRKAGTRQHLMQYWHRLHAKPVLKSCGAF